MAIHAQTTERKKVLWTVTDGRYLMYYSPMAKPVSFLVLPDTFFAEMQVLFG
jgi:hypothetical protein